MKELSLNILDIVQNSIRAEADHISVSILESKSKNHYQIEIADNGNGIPEDLLDKVTDPFVTTRTKRKFGLGLPLLKFHAELAEGKFEIESCRNNGTVIRASFSLNHPDRQPIGDIPGVLVMMIASNQNIDFSYCHSTDTGEYRFSTYETKEVLQLERLSGTELLGDIKEMIQQNLEEINASGLIVKEKV